MEEKSILVVEDEEQTRNLLARIIQRYQIKVFTAGGGREAIEIYKEKRPGCVLLDLKLPDIVGVKVLEMLKEIDPKVKVYLVTGVDEKMVKEEAQTLGAQGCLIKPLDLEEIERIIEDL